jgi:hypothetical protein
MLRRFWRKAADIEGYFMLARLPQILQERERRQNGFAPEFHV